MLVFYSFVFKKTNKKLFICLLLTFEYSQQNSLRRNWMLEQHLVFTRSSSIQFFNSPPFHSQLGHLWYPVQHGMPCHFIGHQVIPTQPLPKEP